MNGDWWLVGEESARDVMPWYLITEIARGTGQPIRDDVLSLYSSRRTTLPDVF